MSEARKAVKMTKHVCRWCRHEYRAPRGTKPKGCPDCAPRLFEQERPKP